MPTSNQRLDARIYTLQFRELLRAVYGSQAYFGDFFAGGLEAMDGISNSATAFVVKTSDIPVVVGTYSVDPNVAFGTGTANTTRFGPRTEIIYTDTEVPYSWNWAIHEGIDRFTVNAPMEAAIADRLELQARAKVTMFNRHAADFIAQNSGHSETLASYSDADILALFNTLDAYFTNLETVGQRAVAVNTALYNAIVNSDIATTSKNSDVDIDTNIYLEFKGFLIRKAPDALFTTTGTNAGTYAGFAYVEGMGKVFTGINTVRTIESEDFDGVALQAAGKAGQFVLDDNKPAIVRIVAPSP